VETIPIKTQTSQSILIIEQIKGQVAKFTFDAENFQIDQLQFLLTKDDLITTPRLASIKINQVALLSNKEDVLLVGQQVVNKI
jgi:hypothetical protein